MLRSSLKVHNEQNVICLIYQGNNIPWEQNVFDQYVFDQKVGEQNTGGTKFLGWNYRVQSSGDTNVREEYTVNRLKSCLCQILHQMSFCMENIANLSIYLYFRLSQFNCTKLTSKRIVKDASSIWFEPYRLPDGFLYIKNFRKK